MNTSRRRNNYVFRLLPFVALVGALAVAMFGAPSTSANHPVLVEGNCDSPVPGTTIVDTGTCGDYDGDGRIGTAEDTDGADRIFGTLAAALGPGTGAAAGTGANQNGRIIIVKSGRFTEFGLDPSTNSMLHINSSAHVQIEAAPGVEANIDAVLQGDPAGGNNSRQEAIGILISLTPNASVTLRNLTIRNFAIGVRQQGFGRLLVENCRVDNNRDFGLQILNSSYLMLDQSQVTGTGRRVGTANNTTNFGHGIQLADGAGALATNSLIFNSLRAGIQHLSPSNLGTFHLVMTANDGGDIVGPGPVVKANF
ncbi:MAG TPA: right-handed parallel beta-helix repeat-containing protein [Pyrinomonadaceae bacterium]|nr:right-handed parallel beta-helix repeat-containing protein [Pyrinomonadaceae bacterium]